MGVVAKQKYKQNATDVMETMTIKEKNNFSSKYFLLTIQIQSKINFTQEINIGLPNMVLIIFSLTMLLLSSPSSLLSSL